MLGPSAADRLENALDEILLAERLATQRNVEAPPQHARIVPPTTRLGENSYGIQGRPLAIVSFWPEQMRHGWVSVRIARNTSRARLLSPMAAMDAVRALLRLEYQARSVSDMSNA